jgi:hypothetical protein
LKLEENIFFLTSHAAQIPWLFFVYFYSFSKTLKKEDGYFMKKYALYFCIGLLLLVLLCCGCGENSADPGGSEAPSTAPTIESVPSTLPTEASTPTTAPSEETYPTAAPTESVRDGITLRDSALLAESIRYYPVMSFVATGAYRGVIFGFDFPEEYADMVIQIDAIGGKLRKIHTIPEEFTQSITLTHSASTPIVSDLRNPLTIVSHHTQFQPNNYPSKDMVDGFVRILFYRNERLFGAAVLSFSRIGKTYTYYDQLLGAVEFTSENGLVPESVALAWAQEKMDDTSIRYPNYIRPQDLAVVRKIENE